MEKKVFLMSSILKQRGLRGMKIRSLATALICLTGVMLLVACGNTAGGSGSTTGDKPESVSVSAEKEKTENVSGSPEEEKAEDHAEAEAEPEKKEEPGKREENSEEEEASTGKSLAQRMAGKYSYHYSDEEGNDEYYIMDVVPFGDNLYAFCGLAMPEDNEELGAYSFWVSEFIPFDADEMTDTDGDTVTVNELRFSIMSNAGKYWDAGYKGTITLTDDGLVFEGFDQEGFLGQEHDGSRLFSRNDRVESAFSYLKDDSRKAPEELQGLWVQSDGYNDLYIEFSGPNMYIYRKEPDHEVFYAAGGCDFHDGSFDFVGNMIENGGMPFEFTGEYKTDGNDLTLKVQGPDVSELFDGSEDYRRVTDREVHVTTMDEVELTSDSFGMFGGDQD